MRFELTDRQRREILGMVLLLLAVVTLLSFFSGPAPSGVGFQWYAAVRQLFGLGGFVLPLVLGIFGVLILWGELKHEAWLDWNDIIGAVLLFLSLLAILAVLWGQNGGGLLGDAIAGALSAVVGKVATFFLFLIIGLIGAMMAFDISIQHIVALFTLIGMGLSNLVRRASSQRTLTIRRSGEEVAPRRRRLLPAMEGELIPARSSAPEQVPEEEEEYPEEEEAEEEGPLPRIIGHTDQRAGTLSTIVPLAGAWQLPSLDLLEVSGEAEISQAEIRRQAHMIEETLSSFNVQARVLEVNCGPTVTQFALQPGTGVKVSKITALSNDLALALSASSIRIEAPVPGRPVIGIEIPNTAISLVSLREILETETFQSHKGALRVALGRDVSGQPVVDDLSKMPHFLIAGTTGSGKSVCINALIVALLYQHTPDSLRFIMIDPKRVELSIFQDIPHLAFPVVTEINGRKVGPSAAGEQVDALKALYWTTQEMERRYRIFAREGFRNIAGYNKAARAESNPNLPPMPYLVFVIDELADLMMVAPDEAETMICRLAQLARATGIHLVLATQRPSVDVVTGLIKANFPSRISFAVSSSVDSRVVLDMVGAEQLLGRGDALYMAPDSAKPIRIQGSFVSDEEIERIVNFWKAQQPERSSSTPVQLSMPLTWHEEEDAAEPEDTLLPDAIALVRKHNRASAALLQRRLRVSFNRASRLIDLLEHKGVVGPEEQGRSREVLPDEAYGEYEE
jgi:S-DNA-T family DNA segregation ATPase FtsK/SpoIIIE